MSAVPADRRRVSLLLAALLLFAAFPSSALAGPAAAPRLVVAAVGSSGTGIASIGTASTPGGFRAPVPLPLTVATAFAAPVERYGPGHRGVDLAVAAGAAIRAAAAGRVVFAGSVAGRPVISIEHEGGLRTTYEPVTATVRAGTPVMGGDVIGTLVAGHPTCPGIDCLHWGARLPDRAYLDPLSLLGTWPVRLWPWTEP